MWMDNNDGRSWIFTTRIPQSITKRREKNERREREREPDAGQNCRRWMRNKISAEKEKDATDGTVHSSRRLQLHVGEGKKTVLVSSYPSAELANIRRFWVALQRGEECDVLHLSSSPWSTGQVISGPIWGSWPTWPMANAMATSFV